MMSVKREYSSSVEPSDSASHTPTKHDTITSSIKSRAKPKSPRTPKKAKATKSSASDNGEDDSPSAGNKGRPGAKARISPNAKSAMAVEIINAGIASLDMVALADKVGLSVQQVRSQLADNRKNMRKQLLELAQTLQ